MSETTTNYAEEFTPSQIAQHIRKVEEMLQRRKHILKTAEAYDRLIKNEDFNTLLDHFQATMMHISLELPNRAPEAQAQDRHVTAAIATVLGMIDNLPSLGADMLTRIPEAEEALIGLRAAQ